MKKYLNKLLITAGLGMFILTSCQKQIAEVYYEGGTAPVLSASLKDTIKLVAKDSTKTAITFTYTNPNYIFSDGLSSQNVTYTLQIDTLGSNFTNPSIQSITGDLSQSSSVTVGFLNQLLATKLGLALNQNHNIQVRLVTSLTNNQAKLISNTLNFSVTPYSPPPLITPPSTGTLFIVGSATPGGWPPLTNSQSVEQFTQVSSTEYQITIQLTGGGEYKLVATPGQWNEQWSVAIQDDPTEVNGGSFILNGNNTLAPSVTGNYDIDVNFQTGKFTVKLH